MSELSSSMGKSFFIMNQNPDVMKEKVSKIEHIKIAKEPLHTKMCHMHCLKHTRTIRQKILAT